MWNLPIHIFQLTTRGGGGGIIIIIKGWLQKIETAKNNICSILPQSGLLFRLQPVIYLNFYSRAVWPDCAIYWTLGNFLKPLATIICPNLPHS